MSAKITIKFLGVGSAFSKKYGNTSALVTVENNSVTKRLMIDCGRTAPDDLVNTGYTWSDVDAIFITHLHGDHVYGIEQAGFMGRYVLNKKPLLIFPDKKMKEQIWQQVLKGTMENDGSGSVMSINDYFDSESVDRTEQYFIFNGVMFSVYPTYHIKNKKSYGLIIGERDYVLYSADSLINADLLEMAADDGCAAIFHDCQFSHYEGKVHASLQELIELKSNVRELIYIMHYGDDLADYYMTIKDSGLKIAARNADYEFVVGTEELPKCMESM